MKKSKLSIFVFMFLSFMTSSYICAQSYRAFRADVSQILERARWQIGPFRVHPGIELRDIGYDDNVYLEPEDREPVSDYTGTFSGYLNVYMLYKNWLIFSLSENPEYVYFISEKNQRAFNNSLSPGLRVLLFQRFVLSGNYSFRRAKRRASSEFEIPATEEFEAYHGSFFYESPRLTSVGISWSSEKINYEDIIPPGWDIELSKALNRTTKTIHFEIYYMVFSQSFLFFSLGYSGFEFENVESRWRDSYSYDALTGIRFPLLGRARGTISLGYRRLVPRQKSLQRFTGMIGNTSFDFRTGRFAFRLRYNRDFQFSFARGNAYFVENNFGVGLSFYLSHFLRLDYDFNLGINNYPELFSLIRPDGRLVEIKRRDTFEIHASGLVFRVFRNIGIGMVLNFWQRESNYLLEPRERWFLGGRIGYEF